jgi:predicted nucleic acid-binding protein
VTPDRILVDTGPLVAMLRPGDSHYEACVTQARNLAAPLLTSWPVLTEAAWLIRSVPNGVAKLLAQVEAGIVHPLDLDAAAMPWMRAFLQKYEDAGAQLADASLCYLSEREGITTIFTLDRRDFSLYRTRLNQPFRLLPNKA